MPNGNEVIDGFILESRFNGHYYYKRYGTNIVVSCDTNSNSIGISGDHAVEYVKLDVLEALMADAKGRVRWY